MKVPLTDTATVLTHEKDSVQAGREIGQGIRDAFRGAAADAVIVFASARHDYARLLQALARESGTEVIAGSSSAGEFTDTASGEGQVSALALRSSSMQFSVGLGPGLGRDPATAARTALRAFRGLGDSSLPYRSALVMADALAGHTDEALETLTLATGGNYTFFGGGAGDDGRFLQTHVFAGTRVASDALVALEILSVQPLGVGVSHGWMPVGAGLRVTQAEGLRIVGLNGMPAVEAFQAHAQATGQRFDLDDPMPFFLHNILGIRSGQRHRLRVPLAVQADGSIACAAPVPAGAVVHLMGTSDESAVQAAQQATRAALAGLAGRPPGAALVFDCVATRLRLGQGFEDELKACAELLQPARFVGCNTYGQLARAEGQFGGFHNCTAVVCVLPE